jgi:hypothetical protein
MLINQNNIFILFLLINNIFILQEEVEVVPVLEQDLPAQEERQLQE